MKFDVTYVCGHSGRVSFYGPGKDQIYWAKQEEEKHCPECFAQKLQEKRAQENELNAQLAKEQELPELLGTPKQVAYGETCRQQLIAKLMLVVRNPQAYATQEQIETAGDMVATLQYIIQKKQYARFWIVTKDLMTYRLIDLLIDQRLNMEAEILAAAAPIPEKKRLPDKPEAVARPENPKSETIVDIRVVGSIIEVTMKERRDDFYDLIKYKLKCTWSSHRWERRISMANGTVEDRAAEIGHRIMHAGFIVRIDDDHIRRKAVEADYEPECTNWVFARTKGEYAGWFVIHWDKEDTYYRAARRIVESRYDKPRVVVPPHQYEELLGFTDQYDFKLSTGAKELLEKAKADRERMLIASVKEPDHKIPFSAKTKPESLPVPAQQQIDAEFLDQD
ncbi:hypothetical protein ACIFOE_25730 [Paenibacillus sp. NRS-1783]|uniref:hypothetical protein n=1 Tax=Paenibacillus sp. NRS-1783 TaxID=3233907 RepID=UPI003D2B35ED